MNVKVPDWLETSVLGLSKLTRLGNWLGATRLLREDEPVAGSKVPSDMLQLEIRTLVELGLHTFILRNFNFDVNRTTIKRVLYLYKRQDWIVLGTIYRTLIRVSLKPAESSLNITPLHIE